MEVDLASAVQDEDGFGIDENNYTSENFVVVGEDETCGICMDTIIDRGVLDCCQHWFCFACIDNWATITNLCPLCQNEFQVITCVPVYDTAQSNKLDDDSYARDDDWSTEGTNNTVSFPSYYIDETSVICLDGDGCKIRSGLAKIEEDSDLDTSIACDSCDLWYHAFCVGFDPESTSESTWLCPRCIAGEMLQDSDASSARRSSGQRELENCDPLTEDTFSRNMYVSSGDTGGTAAVVPIVGSSGQSTLPTLEISKDFETEPLVSTSENYHKLEKTSGMKTIKLEPQELEPSISCDTSISLPSNAIPYTQVWSPIGESVDELSSFDGEKVIRTTMSDSKCGPGLDFGSPASSVLPVDTNSTGTEHQGIKDVEQLNPSEQYLPKATHTHDLTVEMFPADRIVPDASSDAPGMIGGKRKHTDCSDGISTDGRDSNPMIKGGVAVKKIRDGDKIQQIASKKQGEACLSDGNVSGPNIVPEDNELKCLPILDPASELLNIVRTTNRKSSKGLGGPNSTIQSSEEQDSSASLRVKKIMRRDVEGKASSMVVQRLKKEIREAVRNKSSKDIGENQFDPKLLEAFRAALAGSKTDEPVKKLSSLALKARKSMLEKGTVRENLTKKIYATSNGKRKRAWDRDCQIEFWKHRCIGEPEKIKTLKSVLGLLNGSSQVSDTKHESDAHDSASPILSRLYLADTSVFPRKDDIKPLLPLKAAGSSEQKDKQLASKEASSKPSPHSVVPTSTDTNKVSLKVGLPLLETNGNRNGSQDNDTASNKVRKDRHSEGSLVSSSAGSKLKTKKDVVAKTGDVKVDKRKWAMEVLARKMSGTSKNTENEKQEGNSALKGNYPLLAQLPKEMKPMLAPSRHNKVPMAVRQTQLYRMTEHLLRKANLPVMRRTADTELAVADAINIEKEIADRSNSKLVYLNLCSQEILLLSKGKKASGTPVLSSSSLPDHSDRSDEAVHEPSTESSTEAALRNAGLLSDSPPNSPHSNMEVPAKDNPTLDTKEEGPDNILEMDVNPDLDIYGDFEYNLEDEDYIGVTTTKASNMQPEEGESKIKVVFSTFQPETTNHTTSFGSSEKAVDIQKESTCVLENDTHSGPESSTRECETDKFYAPVESIFGKEGEELSAAECEELYGPDKELVIIKFSGSTEIPYGSVSEGLIADNSKKENGSGEDSANHHQPDKSGEKNKSSNTDSIEQPNNSNTISKKVEAYIKEHIRPLCKSGVITSEQYKWAVAKTTEKVMKYHSKAKSASFLIKEGEKVKKLAEQYVETSQKKENSDAP